MRGATGRPPIPIGSNAAATLQHIKSVKRRMHKLRPLKEIRDALAKYGAVWDEKINDWRLNGDDF